MLLLVYLDNIIFKIYFQGGQMDYPPLSSSPLQLTPSLVESQIQRIADTAENMIKAMANVEPKALKNNKKVSKEVEVIIYYFR